MNKVTIIGAGTVGSEIAAILVKRPDVEMVICDRSGEALDRLNNSTASSQVSTHQIDIQDTDQILPLLEGSHTILHAGHPKFNREAMQLALAGLGHRRADHCHQGSGYQDRCCPGDHYRPTGSKPSDSKTHWECSSWQWGENNRSPPDQADSAG